MNRRRPRLEPLNRPRSNNSRQPRERRNSRPQQPEPLSNNNKLQPGPRSSNSRQPRERRSSRPQQPEPHSNNSRPPLGLHSKGQRNNKLQPGPRSSNSRQPRERRSSRPQRPEPHSNNSRPPLERHSKGQRNNKLLPGPRSSNSRQPRERPNSRPQRPEPRSNNSRPAARAAQQRQAQEQARAAQQRQAQEQAKGAQQRQAEEQARAAQQRQAQEQAKGAQQRQAEEQARAAQQRQAQEQAKGAQQRQAEEQARAAQQRQAQEQAKGAQQRQAEEQARAAQQRQAQEQAKGAQQRQAEEQARAAQQRQAQEQRERAARQEQQARQAQEQRRNSKEGSPAVQAVPGTERDRSRVGQDTERAREGLRRADREKGGERRVEVPSRRLKEVQRQREERPQADRTVIREPDRRSIVKDRNRATIRHDENQRLARGGRSGRTERRGDLTALSFASRDGSQVVSEVNDEGRALRRYKRMRDGREIMLFDDRRFYGAGLVGLLASFVDLPPPAIDIPPEQYIVDYGSASEEAIYDALIAQPIEPLPRAYALEEVRQGYWLRERMRRVELQDINFEPGSWEIAPDQYPKLERLARVINRILERNSLEVFLIEGHTDALDSDIDNLTLSDRRAEAVAFILSQMFAVPAENMVTQGYGDQFLKAEYGDSNRRVSVRRITPLLRQDGTPVAQGPDSSVTTPSAPLDLSDDDRAFIVENVDLSAEPRLAIGGITEGMPVPGGARLRSFPSVVRERIPRPGGLQVFRRGKSGCHRRSAERTGDRSSRVGRKTVAPVVLLPAFPH